MAGLDQLLSGQAALELTGMPSRHAEGFQAAANMARCVISSRAVGTAATGLLLEGYATKCFHVKAKSCSWGPMAGLVLTDPRFTKRGTSREAREAQLADLKKAEAHGMREIPAIISDDRRQQLERMGLLRGGKRVEEGWEYDCAFENTSISFFLSADKKVDGAPGRLMYWICYGTQEKKLPLKLDGMMKAPPGNHLYVMACSCPTCRNPAAGVYQWAMTADYDLFALFPEATESRKADVRMVAGSDRFRLPGRAFSVEDPEKGNVTTRLREILILINAAIPHAGSNVVHHSDEAGRPGVSSIEFPFIAFIPQKKVPYAVRSVPEFKSFIQGITPQYRLSTLNPGWFRELGIGVTPRGSFEV